MLGPMELGGQGVRFLLGEYVERKWCRSRGRTVPVFVQVQQLIAPLGDNPECIFKESNDDQESTNGR